MTTEIKNYWNGAVILTVNAETLSYADLSGANLRGADLSGANLRGADLSGADLSGADLSGADLSDANLSDANLSDANLSDANLIYANLSDANLRRADLSGANLSGANLRGADLSGANLRGASGNMREVKAIQCEKWVVTYSANTMWIGCQTHLLTDWWAFDDRTINAMDVGALKWWRKWKPILQAIVEASPAAPTDIGKTSLEQS